jgi:hypothetical protein
MKIFGGLLDGGESVYLDWGVGVVVVAVVLSVLAALSLPLVALVLAMT